MAKKNVDFIPIRNAKKTHNLVVRRAVNYEKNLKKRIFALFRPRTWLVISIISAIILVVAFASYQFYFREKWLELNYKWGMENLSKGKFDQAAKNFESASAGKNEADAMYRLAVSKYNQRDYNGAADAYKKVLEKDSQNAAALNGLGNLYRDEKNYQAAEDYYKKAIGASGTYVIAYSNWAIMLMDMGKEDEAKKVIIEGAIKNPGSTELQNLKKIVEEEN
jgi:tetratricopeptide (TPR) repeat protein